MTTVLFSVFAHGITAALGATWYAKRMADETVVNPDATEKADVSEMLLRIQTKT